MIFFEAALHLVLKFIFSANKRTLIKPVFKITLARGPAGSGIQKIYNSFVIMIFFEAALHPEKVS